jgi:hypothetical protein
VLPGLPAEVSFFLAVLLKIFINKGALDGTGDERFDDGDTDVFFAMLLKIFVNKGA